MSQKIKKLSPWFIGGNLLGFGLLSLLLVLMVQRTTSNSTSTADLRARATEAKGIPVTGRVTATDPETRTLTVESLKMANSDAQIPGTWTAKADETADLSLVTVGATVLLDVNPPTFSIDNHIFTVFSVQIVP